ncbi:hypothetical protein BDA96_10G350000 [Sorghum bicolor]|uniref:Exocyst subunit Exo70 family protein n=3 Tax=Sorghum bicolor TaxID=4558 RepID=A0A921U300_SORBI|nr:hypothetical protein BDA96_10G350000 [Sorghum bicolor]OQU77154.1 hypothetical protein SORBI_3010G272501 [Sorghum bicolor]
MVLVRAASSLEVATLVAQLHGWWGGSGGEVGGYKHGSFLSEAAGLDEPPVENPAGRVRVHHHQIHAETERLKTKSSRDWDGGRLAESMEVQIPLARLRRRRSAADFWQQQQHHFSVINGAISQQQHVSSTCTSVVRAADKVRALLDVRHALSVASEQIIMSFCSSPYVLSTKVADDIGGLFSAQLGKLDQAIRDTFDHIRTAVTPSLDDDDGSSPRATGATQTTLLQSSPAIHKVTRSVINYINIVLSTEALLLPANYASHRPGDTSSLTTLTTEVVGSLEEELARVSRSFTDQSLRFIFLINNSYLIRQLLDTSWPPHLHDLTYLRFFDSITNRIDRYIQSYLQVSWAPVLKCLHNPTCHCFTRDSPLPKFESKFQSTYAAQKHWKVPEPELRKTLRQAIIERVVSGFTEYLEDNNSITSGVTPQELEEMLQELFEG